jgi:hypothetical protein
MRRCSIHQDRPKPQRRTWPWKWFQIPVGTRRLRSASCSAVLSFFTPHTALHSLNPHQPLPASLLIPPDLLRFAAPPQTRLSGWPLAADHPADRRAAYDTARSHRLSGGFGRDFSGGSSLRGLCSLRTGGSRVGSAGVSSSRGETGRRGGAEKRVVQWIGLSLRSV